MLKKFVRWEKQEDLDLLRLRRERLSFKTIGKRLDRTSYACQSRHWLLVNDKIKRYPDRAPVIVRRTKDNPFTLIREKIQRLEVAYDKLQAVVANIEE